MMISRQLIKNPIFSLLIVAAVCVLSTPALMAQNPDTLLIKSVTGNQGDTVIVNVDLYNHSGPVAAIQLGISYNQNEIVPVNMTSTYRTQHFEVLPYVWAPMYDPSMHSVNPGEIRLIAYPFLFDPSAQTIAVGRGPICSIEFAILESAPSVISVVQFEELFSGDNTLSDPDGYSIIPELVDGHVSIGGSANSPPVFDSNNPQSYYNGNVGTQLQFTVRATDADGDLIQLSGENIPSGATFMSNSGTSVVSSIFTWTPQYDGTYNVTFVAEDSYFSVDKQVTINVGGGGGSEAPVITAPASNSIVEGDHLEFTVSVSDPQGDYIYLEALNVPVNGEFTNVEGNSPISSTFSFDPDYSQGGNTFSVTFVAQDASGNSSQALSQIYVQDAPNDFLEIDEKQGALPGSVDKSLIVNLRNNEPVYGIQFDLIYDPQVLDIYSVFPDSGRAFDLAFFSEILEEGRYRVMIFSLGLDSIRSGSGKIVEFRLDVEDDALPGITEVSFDSATSVQDSLGNSEEILFSIGNFGIDHLGDSNLDGIISVGDCVAVIAHLLGWITLGERAFDAADYNRDSDVRIADLMEIVHHILGYTVTAPQSLASAGSVELIRDGIYPGFQGELPIWLSLNSPAAAVQFTLSYDPSEVEIIGLTAGDMVSDLEFKFSNSGNEINAVIYDFDLSEFGPGSGALVNLDLKFTGNNSNPARAINLVDFEIVDVDAHVLKVDVLGELPSQFKLFQNYPNPFNSSTIISFEMPVNSYVRVDIYNVLGQLVNKLFNGQLEAGPYQLMWNGTGLDGENVTSGVYFYRLQTDGFNRTMKMLLVK